MRARAASARRRPCRNSNRALDLGLRRIAIGRNPGLSDLAATRAVRAFVKDAKPDIVHGHGSKGGAYARVPKLIDRNWPTTVYTPHGGSFHYTTKSVSARAYMATETMLARTTDIFLIESDYIARLAKPVIGEKASQRIRVVRNGVSTAEFEPVPLQKDAGDLLYIGELRVLKGIDVLLRAVAQISAAGRELSLLIVGAGPDERHLHDLVAELGLGRQVRFSPPQPIRKALDQAGLMIVPSRAESLPYVVIEATAAAHPLIATNVGGIPEIFGPFADRLVPPDDSEALADAIEQFLSKSAPEKVEQADALANYVRENFSISEMVAGVLSGYREALTYKT